MQVLHAFDSHEEHLCGVDGKSHFHAENDCTLCDLQMDSSASISYYSYYTLPLETLQEQSNFYTFYKDHQQVFYSLRGPPAS